MIPPALLLVFFMSGMAGLLYEVVWVREFGLMFGNTLYSAALVSGVFMVGLGAGGLVAGHLSDRVYRRDRFAPLRLYVASEAGIGILGAAIAAILPRLEPLSARFSSYVAGAHGWLHLSSGSYLFRYGLAVLLVLPVTLLMGGTLTFLIRFVIRSDLSSAGWCTGLLYGLNTAGAATGSLLVDVLWIPRLGLWSTQLLAAGLNIAAALGGLAILARQGRRTSPEPQAAGPSPPSIAGPSPTSTGARSPMVPVAAAIFLSGFAALGMEILWFRFLTSALGQYRLVFSLLLFEILVGLWLGSIVGGSVSRRFGRPASFWIGSQIAFSLSSLGALYFFDLAPVQREIQDLLSRSGGGLGFVEETAVHLGAIAKLVAAPAFFMGFAFPLANAVVQRREESVGRRAGALYLANCLGAVVGSTVTAFFLLPACGMKGTVTILIGCAGMVAGPLAFCRDQPSLPPSASPARRLILGSGLIAAVVCLVAWSGVPRDYLILSSFRAAVGGRGLGAFLRPPYLLATSEGPLETILILDVPDRGRMLFTNGHRMSSTTIGAQRYMRAMSHLPLLHIDDPESVLVICFGVGNTAHAASLYGSVKSIEVVDISEHVLEQAGFFSATNGRILDDPRVRVFVNDGRQHLRMQPAERYDLVTLEPPPINFAGVAALYSKEFYALVRDHLRPGGFVSQWLPIGQVPPETVRSMLHALVEVFPDALLVNGDTSDFILIGRKDRRITLDPAALARRLDANPRARADLERTGVGTPTELFGMFAADAEDLVAGAGRSDAVTDDRPLLEYARIYRARTDAPVDLFDVAGAPAWCPDCFRNGIAVEAVDDLTTYLWIMNEYYARAAPAGGGTRPQGRAWPWDPPADRGTIERAVGRSAYLRRIVPGLGTSQEGTR